MIVLLEPTEQIPSKILFFFFSCLSAAHSLHLLVIHWLFISRWSSEQETLKSEYHLQVRSAKHGKTLTPPKLIIFDKSGSKLNKLMCFRFALPPLWFFLKVAVSFQNFSFFFRAKSSIKYSIWSFGCMNIITRGIYE